MLIASRGFVPGLDNEMQVPSLWELAGAGRYNALHRAEIPLGG